MARGTAAAITAVLAATHSGAQINTAHIERLNATFRGCLAALVRRGRSLAHKETMLAEVVANKKPLDQRLLELARVLAR